MARVLLTLLLFASTALAGRADSLTGVDMRKEYAARREAVADLMDRDTLVLFSAPRRGHDDDRPDPDLFWLTGVTSPSAAVVLHIEYPDATLRARRACSLADRLLRTYDDLRRARWALRKAGDAGATVPPGGEEHSRITGLVHRGRKLFTAERGPRSLVVRLYLPPARPGAVTWTKDLRAGPAAVSRTGIADVRSIRQLYADLDALVREDSRVFTARPSDLSTRARDWLKRSGAIPKPAYLILGACRWVKSAEEIARLRRACELTAGGQIDCMKTARPGQFEYELQARLEFACRRGGARRQAFASVVGSGPNGVILHYLRNDRKTVDGDLVLMDVGAEFMGYAADITRTFPVNGKFTERQAELYDVVLAAQRAGIAAVRPGVDVKVIDRAARAVLAEAGYGKACPHSICHYVGLDVHDPAGGRILEPGVVLTVEPGIYLPDEGTGIRIEDTVVVTEDGCDILSKDVPKERAIIEKLMAR